MENVDKPNSPADPQALHSQQENEGAIRNRNLDILKAYIQRQRALLERIKQDVNRLETSKGTVVAASSSALGHILHSDDNDNFRKHEETLDALTGSVGKLTDLVTEVHGVSEGTITKDVDWNVFRKSDLNPLHTLQSCSRPQVIPLSTRFSAAPPLVPSTLSSITPRRPLSSYVSLDHIPYKPSDRKQSFYQAHVREERSKRVDPVLAIAARFLESLSSDSDDECVKQARVKEAREAKEVKTREVRELKEAKARETKGARKAKNNKVTAKPGKKNGRVSKSARRRKSEASAAAAAVRPRGYGGRFKKKEQTKGSSVGPEVKSLGASTSASGTIPSASTSASSPIDTSPAMQQSHRTPANGLIDDTYHMENGRPQRIRKPSIRFGSAAPSASSSRSRRSGSITSRMPSCSAASDRHVSSSPVVLNNPHRGRLTIRIPGRVPTKSNVQSIPDYRDGQFSASTSLTDVTTIATAESVDTGQVFLAETENGQCGPSGWPIADQTSTPASVIRGDSFFNIKREDRENGRDIDEWSTMDERNGRFKQEAISGIFETSRQAEAISQDRAMSLSDNDVRDGSDSNDSFVPELLPPLPGSSASSSSASRAGASSAANWDSNARKGGTRDRSSRRGDPASKTFNKPWSDEEQRLLDMLLEQYPDGTKNRWANISRAMGGTRTPRQVASRVQKYFAKMKKWGVDLS